MRDVVISCDNAFITASTSARVQAQELSPTNLQASSSGSTVVVSWRAAGDTAPDGYRLEAGSGPGLTDLAVVNIPWHAARGLDARFSAAGVAPGVYYLRVRSIRNQVASLPSDEVMVQVGTASCPLPTAPLNISVAVDSQSITLDWDPAATGGAATGFVVEAGTTPGAPNLAVITLDSTRVLLQATPGRYFIRLRAMGLCGASEPSRELQVIVP
jgi:hypothetical protein